MTDSEIIKLLQTQLKTQLQHIEFLQKTIGSLNQNIQSQTESMIMTSDKTFGKWTGFMNNNEAVATASCTIVT